MADRLLPNKTLRKPTTTPAWFTDKAQRYALSTSSVLQPPSPTARQSKASLTSSSSPASYTRPR
eukprot:1279402-Pleurochrysis_carterae.AAC.1